MMQQSLYSFINMMATKTGLGELLLHALNISFIVAAQASDPACINDLWLLAGFAISLWSIYLVVHIKRINQLRLFLRAVFALVFGAIYFAAVVYVPLDAMRPALTVMALGFIAITILIAWRVSG